MKTRIVCLAPGRVAPGMTLAAAALDRARHALLSAGTVLDAAMLDRLSRRGVEAVTVHVADPRDAETIARELREAEARVALIFRGAGSSPAREELHSAVLHYRRENAR